MIVILEYTFLFYYPFYYQTLNICIGRPICLYISYLVFERAGSEAVGFLRKTYAPPEKYVVVSMEMSRGCHN